MNTLMTRLDVLELQNNMMRGKLEANSPGFWRLTVQATALQIDSLPGGCTEGVDDAVLDKMANSINNMRNTIDRRHVDITEREKLFTSISSLESWHSSTIWLSRIEFLLYICTQFY